MLRWRALSIRARLTVWYTAVLTLMLVAYGTVTYLAARHEFTEQFDDQLHEQFEVAEDLLTRGPDGRVAWTDGSHDAGMESDVVYEASMTDGAVLRRGRVSLPPVGGPAKGSGYRYESVVVGGRRWRMFTATHSVDGVPVLLRVARPEERLEAQVREILTVLLLGLPVAAAIAGLGGYALARRALTPIDHLAQDARRITAERLHERLSVANPNDEIGRLAAVINEMVARLEASFDQLRRFTADASHELRTPLAVIRGIGEVGMGDSRTPAEYRETIGSMLEEIDRLTGLVDTLLRLSRADAGTIAQKREPVDLADLSRDVVASLGILAEERDQRLEVRAAEAVVVPADRLLLREALTNIVDNAVKHSPPGSRIELRVQADDGHAVLAVADEGPGVPAAQRERIFDRFFRLDEARSRDGGGTGLGLAIARWAVETNGGRIAVTDRPGGGAVFRMSFPLVQPAATARRSVHD
jgi:heavy metal sensor kinase